MTTRTSGAIDALLGARPAARRVVALGDAIAERESGFVATAMREKELLDALRAARAPDVVFVDRPSAALRRTLREHRPALLVVRGALAPDEIAALDDIAHLSWLGPHASVHVGGGAAVVVAHAAGELAGLVRALGSTAVRLALAPTPRWLPAALAHSKLDGAPLLGTVAAAVLDVAWARRAIAGDGRDVLVPVGVPKLSPPRPRAPALDAIVAAHALERFTGPVFPSPRVIAILHGHRHGGTAPAHEPDPATLAVWDQARRALPMTGAVLGMHEPDPSLPMTAPTATFLAQRALLRERSLRAVLATGLGPVTAPPDDGLQRAREVLEQAAEELSDQESKVVLRGVGLQVTRQAVANSPSGAAGYAERIGFPVVLKALSPALRRRSEIGAIELELANAAAVRRAYAAIVDNVERRAPTARLDGVVVAEHVPEGLDVQVGVLRMPGGEHAIHACALAGQIAIEPAFALAPCSPTDALQLAHAVLAGIPVPALRRGSDPDPRVLAQVLLRTSMLVERFAARLEQLELSPVRLTGDERGYVILDARLRQLAHVEGR
ncbi:MAG: acetate--CoA ligase family protein [Deltaproteobacteria bacterium]|nr:acetate--CoA ligase family protein [Deltaproteobacteria bacterium]